MNEGLLYRDEEIAEISRPLAEHLALDYSAAALQRFMTHQSSAGHFHSAWNHVEFSMNQSIDMTKDLRQCYIDDAQVLLGDVIRSKKSTEEARLGALTLSSYLPCMQKRAQNETITRQDCLEIYESLGAAIAYLQPLSPDDPPQWRMAETAMLAASARMGQPDKLLYPTSPREEASRVSSENHDSYFVLNDQKLAIQQKLIPTAKEYSGHITLLILQPLMESAYKKNDLTPPVGAADQLNYLLSLIVAETAGVPLKRVEKGYLDHVCRAVAYHHGVALQQVSVN